MAKIVIVEDDQPIREMYLLKFKKAGYNVKASGDGAKGLEVIRSFKPDLVLLDLLIPQISGDELLKQIRSDKQLAKTKVIILTNVGKDEAPPILTTLHAERYVLKAQYTPSQVVKIVKEVLESK